MFKDAQKDELGYVDLESVAWCDQSKAEKHNMRLQRLAQTRIKMAIKSGQSPSKLDIKRVYGC